MHGVNTAVRTAGQSACQLPGCRFFPATGLTPSDLPQALVLPGTGSS